MVSGKFEIVLAQTAGFCMGVRRAVRMVLDAANDGRRALPIRTVGPLIHNRHVLQVLQRQGVFTMDQGGETPGGTVVVRAHGLSLETQAELRRSSKEILDATCPHVRKLQEIAREYAGRGYLCVVVGDTGHAEVESVLSYAGGAGHAVGGPEEVPALPDAEKVVVVAQTTQDENVFHRTVDAVRQRYGDCLSFDTICRSTHQRQAEVRELAPQVDAMIVVGGLNSANTRRLAEISAETGTPTFHVETEQQLDVGVILEFERVGLTAGASTPNWMIQRVIRHLTEEYQMRTHPMRHLVASASAAVVNSGFYAAGAAVALTLANAALLGPRPQRLGLCMAVSFFFVLAQHVLNQYARRQSLYLSEPEKADFFMANEGPLFFLGICASLLSLFLSWYLGGWAFVVVVLGTVAGLVYRFRLPPSVAGRLKFRSLLRLPGSRELFTGLAWATLASIVPNLAMGPSGIWSPGIVVAFGASFLLVVERTLALGLGALESDQLVGRETLVGMLGTKRADRLFIALAVLTAAVLGVGGCYMGWTTHFCFSYLSAVPYTLACFLWLRRRPNSASTEAAMDAVFYLIGVLALLGVLVG